MEKEHYYQQLDWIGNQCNNIEETLEGITMPYSQAANVLDAIWAIRENLDLLRQHYLED